MMSLICDKICRILRLSSAFFDQPDDVMPNNFYLETHMFSDYVLRNFQMEFIQAGRSLSCYRKVNHSYSTSPDDLVNTLSVLPDWLVVRSSEQSVVARTPLGCVRITLRCRTNATECFIDCWAPDAASGTTLVDTVQAVAGHMVEQERSVEVTWSFYSPKGMSSVTTSESFTDQILSASYPWLPCSLDAFTEQYLGSTAPILILYGPPGTGKTRLIRHMLNAISIRRNRRSRVSYTTDNKCSRSDEFFTDFMIQRYDAMVIEDADHLLEPRSSGNQELHQLLAISDGLLDPRGRKLIFSTNLPSKLEIDDALLRPGRCFDCVSASKLNQTQADAVVAALAEAPDARRTALARLRRNGASTYSLAEIYAAVEQG